MRLFLYKLMRDTGAAPHVQNDILSLAICKPKIRRSARPGDWIFGFGARSNKEMRGERLIYVARITDKLANGSYYRREDFRSRWDCIYEWRGGRLEWREGSLFHPDAGAWRKDVGAFPVYNEADVLLSTDYRYLGARGTIDYMGRWPNVGALISFQKQGHRVFQPGDPIARELLEIQQSLWSSPSEENPPTIDWGSMPQWDAGAAREKIAAGRTATSCNANPTRSSSPPVKRSSRC